MKHIAPHLWAEIATLGPSKRRAMLAHADTCERCAEARQRIAALPATFEAIREKEAPSVAWDHVGARIHWSQSLERRTGERPAIRDVDLDPRSRRWPLALATSAALAAALLLIWRFGFGGSETSPRDVVDESPSELAAMPVDLAEGHELSALIMMTQGDVVVDGDAPRWREPLRVGQTISTDDGRIVVQFARGGGFALGPSSTVTMRSFDSHSIELVLEGTLEVQVQKRAPNQQFVIALGDRTVSVKGTAFRVSHREGDIDVACEHGRVEVSDGAGIAGVDGGERLVVERGADLETGATAMALSADEAAALAADLKMPLVSAFSDAPATLDATRSVSVLADGEAGVSVDGVLVGKGAMQLRLLVGRHEIQVKDAGPWARGRWIDLDGRQGDVRIVHADYPSAKPRGSARVRLVQLRLALKENRARLRRCLSRMAAHGVDRGVFVDLDVSVNADGSLAAVNAGNSNVDLDTRRCVLNAVGSMTLPKGPKGSARVRWRP